MIKPTDALAKLEADYRLAAEDPSGVNEAGIYHQAMFAAAILKATPALLAVAKAALEILEGTGWPDFPVEEADRVLMVGRSQMIALARAVEAVTGGN